MGYGYNIIAPNGYKYCVNASCQFPQRVQQCEQIIRIWEEYCLSNWMNQKADNPYSPENRVKNFLSSIGYFLLIGYADDIMSPYKGKENLSREIPVSSCPLYVGDMVYGSLHPHSPESEFSKEGKDSFDEFVSSIPKRTKPHKRVHRSKDTRYDRVQKARQDGAKEFVRQVVDTDGLFMHDGKTYRIDTNSCPAYKATGIDQDEYSMTYVIVATGTTTHYYDQSFRLIDYSVSML